MTTASDRSNPERIFLFCGKRKSGKDFITDRLLAGIKSRKPELSPVIIRLSGPIKQCYAETHGLNYEELLSSSSYKEQHRLSMITWSEAIRNTDYGYFCRAALDMFDANKFNVWIVSDCRRKTDFRFFEERFPQRCRRVRVQASEEVRASRGFVFQQGVDDAESECGLDDISDIHFVIQNDGKESVESLVEPIMSDLELL